MPEDFQIGDRIGGGGFGEVHECVRLSDGIIFARKTLVDNSEETVRSFTSEVKALSRLNHPHIVQVIHQSLSGAPYFYVMPRYKGSMAEFGVPSGKENIAKVFRGICEAIDYAHRSGVIHRDLKPHNVLVNSIDDFVVSDFGFCRIDDPNITRYTRTGDQMGTQGYSAPEQFIDAKKCDARSDIFALGRILLFLHTGLNVHQGADVNTVPGHAALVITRATQTDPTRRYQTVSEMTQHLKHLETIAIEHGAPGQLLELLEIFKVSGNAQVQDIKRTAELIRVCRDNSDTLHDFMIDLREDVFHRLYAIDPDAIRILVTGFSEHSLSRGWSFGYTDKIGSACHRAAVTTLDENITGIAAATAAIVAQSHNRFAVMDIARDLLGRCRTNRSALAAVSVFNKWGCTPDFLSVTEFERLHPALMTLVHQGSEVQG